MSDVAHPNPSNPGHRTKAARLRKRAVGGALTPEEIAWLSDYDSARAEKGARDVGGSMSERIVNIEERSAAVGTGAAAEVAAAAALAREEGRRFDYLMVNSVNALMKAVETYKTITDTLLQRTLALEEVHMGMLGTVREQYVARVQAEVDAIAAGAGKDDNEMMNQVGAALIQKLLSTGGSSKPPPK